MYRRSFIGATFAGALSTGAYAASKKRKGARLSRAAIQGRNSAYKSGAGRPVLRVFLKKPKAGDIPYLRTLNGLRAVDEVTGS